MSRVLVCSPRMPEPDRESGSRRLWHAIRFLREAGHEVVVLVENARGGEQARAQLTRAGVPVWSGFSGEAIDLVRHGRFDLAIVAFWYTAETLIPLIREVSPRTRVLLDSVDLNFVRQSRQLLRPAGGRRGRLDQQFGDEASRELDAYASADAVLAVSRQEADLVDLLLGVPGIAAVVPDGEDLGPSPVAIGERRGIVFLGNFQHPPNEEALRWLAEEVVPRIDRTLLEAHPLRVVGNRLDGTHLPLVSAIPGAVAVGWVPDAIPYLERARVSVVPLLNGAGTKRKLLQALMVGTPTVTTSIGAEGLPVEDGRDLLVRDDPEGFARAIGLLLTRDDAWSKQARQGRETMLASHGLAMARERLLAVVDAQLALVPPRSDAVAASPEQAEPGFNSPGSFIVASPNPVVAWPGPGTATVVWEAEGKQAEVRVAVDGGRESLFATGPRGRLDAPWIMAGRRYRFRLYRDGRREPLAETFVHGIAAPRPPVDDGRALRVVRESREGPSAGGAMERLSAGAPVRADRGPSGYAPAGKTDAASASGNPNRSSRARTGALVGRPTTSGYLSVCHDHDLLDVVLPTMLPHLDELVVVDGAYEWMAAWHRANGQDPVASPATLARIAELCDVPMRVLTGPWKNEVEKRAAGYEACSGDLVWRLDADEFFRVQTEEVARFAAGEALAAEMELPILVSPGWLQVDHARAASPLPRAGALFKRRCVSAQDHLRYIWMVDKPDWGIGDGIGALPQPWPGPVSFTAHLTGWRPVESARKRAAFYVFNHARNHGLPWHPGIAGRPVHDSAEVLSAVGVEAVRDLLDGTEIVCGTFPSLGGAVRPANLPEADRLLLEPRFAAFLDSHRERNRDLRGRTSHLASGQALRFDITGAANLEALTAGRDLGIDMEIATGSIIRAEARIVTLGPERPCWEETPLSTTIAGGRVGIALPDGLSSDARHLRRSLVLHLWMRDGCLHEMAFR